MTLVKPRPWHRPPSGSPPGTITVNPSAAEPRIDVISYGPDADPGTVQLQRVNSISDLPELPAGHTVRWVNVSGLGNADVLRSVGEHFGIHDLVLEDIGNTAQRPKAEAYREFLFIVTRVPVPSENAEDGLGEDSLSELLLGTEQLSICLGNDFVITFHEGVEETFEPVRRRLLAEGSLLRGRGADYLAYALLDAAIDSYFPLLEEIGEEIEELEDDVIRAPAVDRIGRIHAMKRNLLTIRRAVWPQREMLSSLIRGDSPLVSEQTRVYLRDCQDHAVEIIDTVETYREITSGLVDILLSSQSNRMNEVMKVLTIIATIFIPLSWIAGVYGMNFNTSSPWNLPELEWRFGYFYSLGLMLLVAVLMSVWFWRKGWIGERRE